MTEEIQQPVDELTTDPHALRERLGDWLYAQRMAHEPEYSKMVFKRGRVWFHPDNMESLRKYGPYILKAMGIYQRGLRNAVDLRVVEHEVWLNGLPEAFDGYRMCQITDMHIDAPIPIKEAIIDKVQGLEYDCSLLTGDFRMYTFGSYKESMEQTKDILEHLRPPFYGIFGNHDFIEQTLHLEAMGIRMLMNEHVLLEKDGAQICLVGIDDPHLYQTDDLPAALQGVPDGMIKILLSHSASTFRQAQGFGVHYLIAGHTHGGQACLPGGKALMNLGDHPWYMLRGPWRYHELQGYTSPGTGASFVPVRYNCPPEITIHILRRKEGG